MSDITTQIKVRSAMRVKYLEIEQVDLKAKLIKLSEEYDEYEKRYNALFNEISNLKRVIDMY